MEAMRRALISRQTLFLWWLPALMLAIASIVFRVTDLDLMICRLFFDAESQSWPMFNDQPWIFLFYYGVYLPLAVGILGAVLAVFGPWFRSTRRFSRAGLFVGLAILLGPGLIINGLLKPSWGRPRPTNCVQFGGDRDYHPLGFFQGQAIDRSFPSGHASIGFFLAVPALLLIHRHRRWALAIFAVGMTYGAMMGLGRVVQGRHFPSDIIWSLAITYFSALFLLYVLRLHRPRRIAEEPELETAPSIIQMRSGVGDESHTKESPHRGDWLPMRRAA